ncbi:MAG: hypothetical protein HY207_04350 [Nitrospirae bacterium]|nr:hypothetical protein [Nitrospirota bacterium]
MAKRIRQVRPISFKEVDCKQPAITQQPAISINMDATEHHVFAYLLVADQHQTYGSKHSRIVYIGQTTNAGLKRAAASIARKAIGFFDGKTNPASVKRLEAYLVCQEVGDQAA